MIKNVALIGCGAIGSYFVESLNNRITIIANGKRKERLKKDGLWINDKHYTLNVQTEKSAGKQDLILIGTKADGLKEAISYLPYLLKEDTIVLSLLNGVTSEEKIIQFIPKKHVLHSFMKIGSYRKDNRIYFDINKISDLYYGSLYGNRQQLHSLSQFLKTTQIHFHEVDNILEQMWLKYACNIANNLPQAVLQVNSTLYTKSEHGYKLASLLWFEVYKVAQLKGIQIPEQVQIFPDSEWGYKYSTLQDIEQKRETEVDLFLKELINMACELHIQIPFSEMTYHYIKALEEKNKGYFE
ncbi:MAG: 2-dehydropantoate 2-reductase [Erysipelotrichaceae bacterium]|nr:2-dehydropantoate 2-reductase [Erysipelotrichaceae bacterium]